MKAIIAHHKQPTLIDKPVPNVAPGTIRVRVEVVAQNPTDWKAVGSGHAEGTQVGCDFAGVVDDIGPGVTTRKKGDRIAGCVHGCRDENSGSFAEVILADPGLTFKIPDHVTFEQAATLPVAMFTQFVSLYKYLGVELPSKATPSQNTALVWSGATSSGTAAIQWLKFSKWRVVTTCSPAHHEMMRTLGADYVFDYRDVDVVQKIKEATQGGVMHAIDTISEKGSTEIVAQAMRPRGHIIVQLPVPPVSSRPDLKVQLVMLYDITGIPYKMAGRHMPGSPELHDFIGSMMGEMHDRLDRREITFAPIKVMPKGLAGVPEGFEEMKQGKVRGTKLVYRIRDTAA